MSAVDELKTSVTAEKPQQETEPNDQPKEEEKMTVASKEIPPGEEPSSSGDGIFPIVYSVVKKVIVVGTIYLVGYMGWSVAWLITPVILSVAREQWRKSMELKRNIAKTSALANERDVILARIDELPAWVYFPDVERCEWVNRIVKQVWPNANHYARDLVKNSIGPSVAAALANYKLNGFKFDRVILGTIPPRFGGVKIYDKNVSRNEIIMDLDLFYASDCDINFVLAGIKGGIKDFQIHGTIRVVMKPLISTIPLVGGLQVFFLNNPNVDFNLVGVADLLDMPGLSDIIRRVIVEQVAAIMVLPNKLTFTLSDAVEASTLKMPEPEGVLRIHVIEAKNLMKKDISVLGKGKSDPYAVVHVGAQQFKTNTIENNVNPKWDYWCEAQVNATLGQEVGFSLWDWDPGFPGVEKDDFLGRATIEISHVVKKGVLDSWLVLEGAKHGMVHVRLTWLHPSTNSSDLKAALQETQMLRVTSMSSGLLTVYIDSAKNLPQARSQSQPDPFVVLTVGKHTEQTTVQMRTDSPVWEQGFTFLVSNPDNDTLQLKVVDQKTGNEIGRLIYIMSTLLQNTNLEIISQPFQLQKSGPESKIIMAASLRILIPSEPTSDNTEDILDDNIPSGLQRQQSKTPSITSSIRTTANLSESSPLLTQKSESVDTASIREEPFTFKNVGTISSTPTLNRRSDEATLHHRSPDVTNSAGEAGLGRIQLTLRYSIQRQKLTVIVHKIMNIPLRDPSNIPDPYIKLYLLNPGRSKETKRKTVVIKDNCNPVYEATFEYLISIAEMMSSDLEVTIASKKGLFSGGSPVIGIVKIPLKNPEIKDQGFTSWYDLLPESKDD